MKTITVDELKKDVGYLASDELQGRKSLEFGAVGWFEAPSRRWEVGDKRSVNLKAAV